MQRAVAHPLRLFLRTAQCTRSGGANGALGLTTRSSTSVTSRSSAPVSTAKSIWRTTASTFTAVSGLRTLSTSSTQPSPLSPPSSQSPPTTLTDPSRSSLFYHLLPAPNPLSPHLPAYAVSFLEHPPKDAQNSSPAVIGWLPAAIAEEGGEEAGLGDFKENPKFINKLHEVVQMSVEDGTDERLKAEAIQLGEGWMHINDDRNLPAMGRISSPDDIIASVRVEDGQMLPETYSPMPTYRTCTADGLTTLSEELERRLLSELRRTEDA